MSSNLHLLFKGHNSSPLRIHLILQSYFVSQVFLSDFCANLIIFWFLNELFRCEDDKPFMPMYQVSKDKTKTLGIEFIPLEQSLKESVESLKEKNLV